MTQPGGITMTWPDYRRRQCRVDGWPVSLSPAMTEILSMLLMRRGQVVSTGEIIDALWPDPDTSPDDGISVLKVQICKLRQRIGGVIATRPQHGYIIDLPHAGAPLALAA